MSSLSESHASCTGESDPVRTQLLAFLAPGLAHALASPLQVIQTQTALLGSGNDLQRGRDALQRACGNAERLLDVLRCLCGPPNRTKSAQVGLYLPRLLEVLRFALRERGIRIEALHASIETPVHVAQGPLTVALARLIYALAFGVPAWWKGAFYVDLREQAQSHATLVVGLQSSPGFLPFEMSVRETLEGVARDALAHGVGIEWDAVKQVAVLKVPTAAAVSRERG